MLNGLIERQKHFQRLQNDLNKVQEVNSQLTRMTAALQELVPMAQALNFALPESDRLTPLKLDQCNLDDEQAAGDLEQRVVDGVL